MLYQDPIMNLQSIAPNITSFPVEILAEIFLHCLPDSPLNEAQPNLRVAPMLLCHVCSSWRAISLSLPRLWSHLCVTLPMREGHTTDPVTVTWNLEALPNMIQFMRWWRGYQRLGAPFIRIKSGQEDGIDEGLLPDDVIAFLFQYLSSAQHIDIARGLLARMLPKGETEDTESEYHGLSPNLRTLVVECGQKWTEDEDSFLFVRFPISIPATLRRLSLRCAEITTVENWSLLTHISLENVLMHSSDWLPLIRIFRNLQWGFFEIYIGDVRPSKYSPRQTTLPCLRTLILIVDDPFARLVLADPPTQLFFMNLYLPALRNLSMKSRSTTWKHPVPSNAIAEIKNLLRSAPKIQDLALGPQFLCFKDHSDSDAPSAYHESCLEIDTLSSLAPNLSHLQLELPYRHERYEWQEETVISDRLALWCRSFSYMHWFDLESPKNVIRKITVVVQMGRNASLVEGLVRDKLTAFTEKYKQKAPGVEFAIIWEKKEGKPRSVDEWSTRGSI